MSARPEQSIDTGRADRRDGREEPRRVLLLIKGLGPGGAEHLVLASCRARERERFAFEVGYLLAWKDALVDDLRDAGVRVECLDVADERDLRWVVRLRRRLRRDPVDVVHAHSPYVAAMTRLAVRSLPARVRPAMVTTEHNAWSTLHPATRLADAWTARLDDATIAVSEETRASMPPRRQARTETLVHGIDVAAVGSWRRERAAVRAELGVGDQLLVGTVANYHPKKDWPNLLAAARLVADARAGRVRFVFVGQGPLQHEVESRHAALGLGDVATLTGHRPDAVRLMAACDLFVLASQWEGLPVALMEALALGLPVVATAVGGVAETLTDRVDGRLVPPHDASALADAIVDVLDDAPQRERLAAAALARAPEFDAARAQRRIEEIYREVSPR